MARGRRCVETVDEFYWFNDLNVNMYQGYLLAKPMFEAMPPFQIPIRNELQRQ